MGSRLRYLVPGHLYRIQRIGEIHEVHVAGHQARRSGLEAVEPGAAPLVTHDDVEPSGGALIGKSGVGRAVEIAVTGNLHRVRRAAPLYSVPDIDQHHAVRPIRGVCNAVHHPHVMDAVARGIQLEPAHSVRVLGILDIDNVEPAAVVDGVYVIVVDEDVVYASRQTIIKLRMDLHVAGVRNVQHQQPVAPVGGALPGDDRHATVFRDLHVVHRSGIDHDAIDHLGIGGIGHIPEVCRPVCSPGASHRVVPAVDALPDPQVRCPHIAHRRMPDELHFLRHKSVGDQDGLLRDVARSDRHDGVLPGVLRHKQPLLIDLGGRVLCDHRVSGMRHQGVRDGRVLHPLTPGVQRNGRGVEHVSRPRRILAHRQ